MQPRLCCQYACFLFRSVSTMRLAKCTNLRKNSLRKPSEMVFSLTSLNKLLVCQGDIRSKPAGSFKAPHLQSVHTTPLSEQITVQQAATEQSHTAGFDVSSHPLQVEQVFCIVAHCYLNLCSVLPLTGTPLMQDLCAACTTSR